VREESYVVRIYRRPRGEGSAVEGVVEAVRTGWQKPFQSLQELTDILQSADVRSAPPGLRDSGVDQPDVGERNMQQSSGSCGPMLRKPQRG
jgi:hypothetical protein